jgi:hypothetical protein
VHIKRRVYKKNLFFSTYIYICMKHIKKREREREKKIKNEIYINIRTQILLIITIKNSLLYN